MKSVDDYRNIAESCMQKADAAMDERDRPLWEIMAQSWLRLAEHRERIDSGHETAAIGLDGVDHNGGSTAFN
jgi:hypothetical protein